MISHEVALRENVAWLTKNQLIYVVYHGDQTPEKLSATVDELRLLCLDLRARQQPVLILADIRDIGENPPEAKAIGMRARTELPFWRMAIMTGKDDANTILSVSHQLSETSARRKEIAYFSSLPEARRWLCQLRNDEDLFYFLQPLEYPYRTAM